MAPAQGPEVLKVELHLGMGGEGEDVVDGLDRGNNSRHETVLAERVMSTLVITDVLPGLGRVELYHPGRASLGFVGCGVGGAAA
jgi:hypothetical protein